MRGPLVPGHGLLTSLLDRVKDKKSFLKRVRELNEDAVSVDQCEVELNDGRTLERHSMVVRSPAGENLGRVWFVCDISSQKRIENSLRETEQHFYALTEAAQDAIVVVNSLGVIQYRNPAAQRTLGYSSDEALGKISTSG